MHISAIFRFLIAAAAGITGGLITISQTGNNSTGFVILWDIFTFCLVLLSLREFITIKKDRIKMLCATEDASTWLLFGLVITACTASLITLIFSLDSASQWNIGPIWSKAICIFAVIFSWILLHTSFTFRYAHMYYGDHNERYSKTMRGLDFPGKEAPDYFDFAYFAFVMGMTFQVSDVVITSPAIRRLALLHSLISFAFNTVIVALTVSQLV